MLNFTKLKDEFPGIFGVNVMDVDNSAPFISQDNPFQLLQYNNNNDNNGDDLNED